MSTEAIAAGLAAASHRPPDPAVEGVRVTNAFDSAVLAVRQENGALATGAGDAAEQLTDGLRVIHADSRRMTEMMTRLAERRGNGAADGWNYQALQVSENRNAGLSVGRASTADLLQLYQMMTRTQLLSKVCNMVPDVCTSIIKAS